jgi:hypothetical protein
MDQKDAHWVLNASLVFLIAILLVLLMPTAPGMRVTFYAVIAAVAVAPALYRSAARRSWSVAAVIVALSLIIWDHQTGIRFWNAVMDTLQWNAERQRQTPEP